MNSNNVDKFCNKMNKHINYENHTFIQILFRIFWNIENILKYREYSGIKRIFWNIENILE